MIRRLATVLGLLALTALAPAAAAQEPGAAPPAAGYQAQDAAPAATAQAAPAADGFRAAQAQQARERTMRGYWHLFIAFAAGWVLLFGYALTLGSRTAKLERRLERFAE